MRFCLVFFLLFFSCGKDEPRDRPPPTYPEPADPDLPEPFPDDDPDNPDDDRPDDLPDPRPLPQPEPGKKFCPPNDLSFRDEGPFSIRTGTGSGYIYYRPLGIEKCESPLVFWNNGTGARCQWYSKQLRHWASWGYTVICAMTSQSGNGRNCFDSFKYVQGETGHIAIAGHSQGGAGAMACAYLLQQSHPNLKYAIMPVQPALGMGPAGQNPKVTGAKWVTTGSRDTLVPASVVVAGYRALQQPKIWYSMEGATHYNSQSWMDSGGLAFMNGYLLDYPEAREAFDTALPASGAWRKLSD